MRQPSIHEERAIAAERRQSGEWDQLANAEPSKPAIGDRQSIETMRVWLAGTDALSADVRRKLIEGAGYLLLARYPAGESHILLVERGEQDDIAVAEVAEHIHCDEGHDSAIERIEREERIVLAEIANLRLALGCPLASSFHCDGCDQMCPASERASQPAGATAMYCLICAQTARERIAEIDRHLAIGWVPLFGKLRAESGREMRDERAHLAALIIDAPETPDARANMHIRAGRLAELRARARAERAALRLARDEVRRYELRLAELARERMAIDEIALALADDWTDEPLDDDWAARELAQPGRAMEAPAGARQLRAGAARQELPTCARK